MNSREIKELVRHHRLGISPRRMGQNFLVDPRILARIVGALGPVPGDTVLEIGAGLGALTEGLIESGASVLAVEKDAGFFRALSDRLKGVERLQFIHSDILKLDLGSYAANLPKSLLVAGNIPYSLTSPILEFLLRHRRWVKRAILTVQKEVALRIVAEPGTKAYSSITVLAKAAFKPSVAFTIPPNCFYPQPKVTSAVLLLDSLESPPIPPEEEEAVLKLARSLFMHRRKTLLNVLSLSESEREKSEFRLILEKAGLDPVRRPETLGLAELLHLKRALAPAR